MDPNPQTRAANSIDTYIPTFETYFNSEVNHALGSNYAFELYLYNGSHPIDQLVSNQSIDFYFGTAANTACLETSYAAVAIATIVKPLPGGGGIDGYGGAIVASATNSRINSLLDLKGSIFGIEYQQGWGSNLLQIEALIQNGVYVYRDAKEVATGSQQMNYPQIKMLQAVQSGQLDAAFIRADNIHHFQSLNMTDASYFKVLGALQGVMIPGTSTPYPYPVSTPIYPEWAISAFPWVDRALAWQVLKALLSINASSYPAVYGSYLRWETALDYTGVAFILQDTGALITDPATGRRHCPWLDPGYDVYSVPSCPAGSFKVSEDDATAACRALNRTCPGPACWCGVCKVAREVEVAARGLAGGNGSVCDKMRPCAAAAQRAGFALDVYDNRRLPGLRVTYALGGLGAAPTLTAALVPGTPPWNYSAVLCPDRVGTYLLQVSLPWPPASSRLAGPPVAATHDAGAGGAGPTSRS